MKNIFFGTLLLLSLFSCKREKDEIHKTPEKVGEETLSSADLLNVPYTLNDRLVFKDSLGDSMVFNVQSRASEFQTYYVNSGAVEQDFCLQEKNITTFFADSITPLSQIVIFAKQPPAFGLSDGLKGMYFRFCLPGESVSDFFACGIRYDMQLNFFTTQTNIAVVKHPTYSILSHSYTDVYELNSVVLGATNPTTTLYYSTTRGIVGFKELSGEVWYLAN